MPAKKLSAAEALQRLAVTGPLYPTVAVKSANGDVQREEPDVAWLRTMDRKTGQFTSPTPAL